MAFFVNFDLFFGILLVLSLKCTHIFATTDTTTYFKVIPINIFMKKLFSDDIDHFACAVEFSPSVANQTEKVAMNSSDDNTNIIILKKNP